MRRNVLAVAFLVTLHAVAQDVPATRITGFRGLVWGATEADVKAASKFAECRGTQAERNCTAYGLIGSTVTHEAFLLPGGRFTTASFHFQAVAYDSMKATFIEKYGEPTERNEGLIGNANGAQLPNEELVWKDGSGVVRLLKYWVDGSSGGVNELRSLALIIERAAFEESEKKAAEERKKAAASF